MKKILFMFSAAMLTVASVFTSCDEHFDFPDTSMKVGDILCTDGDVLHPDSFEKSGKEAIGVVFYLNNDADVEGTGYAVYLYDLNPAAMSDTCGLSQKTSCDLEALDGNLNTYALMNGQKAGSPLASAVFDLWRYGQSAYVPSVAQLRLLFASKLAINPMLQRYGGDLLPDDANECWYWSSTEVDGQSDQKAWLFSMQSGTIQETPKIQEHKSRPIITINH